MPFKHLNHYTTNKMYIISNQFLDDDRKYQRNYYSINNSGAEDDSN